MSEPAKAVATQVAPEAAKPSEVKAENVKASDILKRASSELAESKPSVASEELPQLGSLDDIKDPIARALVEKKYKDLLSGYNKKFEQLAEERKTLAREKEKLAQPWTPERVNQLLSDPKFVESAQSIAEQRAPQQWQGSSEEWSALAPQEQQAFKMMQNQVQSLMLQQSQSQVKEIDNELKSTYPDYDPEMINGFAQKYDRGEIDTRGLRELVYKGLNFEKAVERAYQLASKDRNGIISDKMNASSQASAISTTTVGDKPVMEKGESSAKFFSRLARWNMTNKL